MSTDTYAPPDYATNAKTRLQAFMAGQTSPALPCGPYDGIVQSAQKKSISAPEGQKGNVVRQWLRETIRVNGRDGFYHELEIFLDLDCTPLSPEQLRANAGTYLRSLCSGVKPDIRPELSRDIEPAICMIESAFAEHKTTEERIKWLPRSIHTIGNTGKFKKLHLEQLLTEDGTAEQTEANDSPTPDQEAIMPPLPASARLDPELAKNGCWWVDMHEEYSKKASPEGFGDFHTAGGIFDLSTVAAGRIKLPGGANGQHTALNFAYVAKPGAWVKSTTAEAAVSVIRDAGLGCLLGPDETTPQKMLSDMGGKIPPPNFFQLPEDKQERWKKRLAMAGQRGWYYDELGAFFRAMNKPNGPMGEFRGLLLKLDSRLPSYTYATQSRGHEEVDYPYLALLGCTTFADFRAVAKAGSDDWNDGMLSRFIPIVPPPGPALESPFTFETISVPYALSSALREMHEWLGYPIIDVIEEDDEKGKGKHLAIQVIRERPPVREIRPDAEVEAAWNRYRSALRTMEKPEDLASSYVRLPVKALRVAALFAGIEKLTTIEMRHWAKAQEIAERWRKSLHELYVQVNTSSTPAINSLEKKVQDYLDKHPESKARDVYQNLNIDAEIAKKVLFNLIRSGDIEEVEQTARNGRSVKIYSSMAGRNK